MADKSYHQMLKRLPDRSIQPHETKWLAQLDTTTGSSTWETVISEEVGVLVPQLGTDGKVLDHYLSDRVEEIDDKKVIASWKNELGQRVIMRAGRLQHIADRHTGKPGEHGVFFSHINPVNAIASVLNISGLTLPAARGFITSAVTCDEPIGWTTRYPAEDLVAGGYISQSSWQSALTVKDEVLHINTYNEAAQRPALAKQLARELGDSSIRFAARGTGQNKIVPIVLVDEVPETKNIGLVLASNGSIANLSATVLTTFPGGINIPSPFDLSFEAEQLKTIAGSNTLGNLATRMDEGRSVTTDQAMLIAKHYAAHESAWETPFIGLRGW